MMTPPSATALTDIVNLLNDTLHIHELKDAPVALNGLQLENNGQVTHVALAVDASQATLEAAIAAGADLLIVHHGLFWSGLRPLTGWWKKKVETCFNGNLAVYAAHLPLDMHETLGNNACISRALGLTEVQPEISYGGTCIGMAGTFAGTVGELAERYAEITGAPVRGCILTPDAPAGRIAICSGGAAGEIYQAAAKGYTCYLSGEELHWAATAAEDMGINLLLAGHYATETFGVNALGELISEHFGVPCTFIDMPTGM